MKFHFRIQLLLVVSCSIFSYAGVGKNNVTINIGGTFNYSQWLPNVGNSQYKKDNTYEYIGGGFNVELGYLYLSQGSVVNGFDMRINAAVNFDPIYRFGGKSVDLSKDDKRIFDSMSVSLDSTYVLGNKIGDGYLLVDVLGINLGYITGLIKDEISGVTATINPGNHFLLGINLPLGIQYIFDNGFMIGFRHYLNFAFGETPQYGTPEINGNKVTYPIEKGGMFGTGDTQASYLAYNITFKIGYAFGK